MSKKFFAKSNPLQSIEEHTNDLLRLYQSLKEKIAIAERLTAAEWELLRDAAIYHDVGKINPHFQYNIQNVLLKKGMTGKEIESKGYDFYSEQTLEYLEVRHNLISPYFIDFSLATKKYALFFAEVLSSSKEMKRLGKLYGLWLLRMVGYHHYADFTRPARLRGNNGTISEVGMARFVRWFEDYCAVHFNKTDLAWILKLEEGETAQSMGEVEPYRSILNQNMEFDQNLPNRIEMAHGLSAELESIREGIVEDSGLFRELFLIPPHIPDAAIKNISRLEQILQCRYMLLKGLLNKLDYCASAGLSVTDESVGAGEDIASKTHRFMKRKGFHLRPVQEFMLEASGENVIVESSTGSGKTEAALLWIGESKGFYTLPLKVSINAMYERIRREEGIHFLPVKLLHGDAFGQYCKENKLFDDSDLSGKKTKIGNTGTATDGNEQTAVREYTFEDAREDYNSAKLMTAPLLVTTIDQLFTYVYRYNGSELSFASVALGKVVIDEIQMYEPHLVAKLIRGLKMLTNVGGKFAIITATFPKLLYRIFDDYGIPYKKVEKNKFYGEYSCRHKLALLDQDEFDLDLILRQARNSKVLVIVNRVARVQEMYELLRSRMLQMKSEAEPDTEIEIRMLHSNFIKKHRSALENAILKFAPNDARLRAEEESKSGIWITTSIVEASLDLDFDYLHTELLSIDSLIQRMGRVYRERDFLFGMSGRRMAQEDIQKCAALSANIYVLLQHNAGRMVSKGSIQGEIYEKSRQALLTFLREQEDGLVFECLERDDVVRLMDAVYDDSDEASSGYREAIQSELDFLQKLGMYATPQKEAKEKFRDIVSYEVIPVDFVPGEAPLENQTGGMNFSKAWDYEGERAKVGGCIQKLVDKNCSILEKEKARQTLAEYTMNLQGRDVDLSSELYPGSRIYKYYGHYDFNEETSTGKGLVRNRGGKYPETLFFCLEHRGKPGN